MSEPKPAEQYRTQDPVIELIFCSGCHATVGWYIQVGDQVWIQTGALQLYSAHGRCACCEAEWHWASTDKLMEDLLKHHANSLTVAQI